MSPQREASGVGGPGNSMCWRIGHWIGGQVGNTEPGYGHDGGVTGLPCISLDDRQAALAIVDASAVGALYCRGCGHTIGVTGIAKGICDQPDCTFRMQEQVGRREEPDSPVIVLSPVPTGEGTGA